MENREIAILGNRDWRKIERLSHERGAHALEKSGAGNMAQQSHFPASDNI